MSGVRTRPARRAILAAAVVALTGCDPGSEAGFAPVDPLPTPDPQPAPALWWPAEADAVNRETRVLDVFVLEQACAGGESAAGRILPPEVDVGEQEVVVTFLVEPVGEVATCPTNPPTPASLDLGEPLGDRTLLDGATDPPREPAPED